MYLRRGGDGKGRSPALPPPRLLPCTEGHQGSAPGCTVLLMEGRSVGEPASCAAMQDSRRPAAPTQRPGSTSAPEADRTFRSPSRRITLPSSSGRPCRSCREGCSRPHRITSRRVHRRGPRLLLGAEGAPCGARADRPCPGRLQAPSPGPSAAGISRNTFACFMQPHWDTPLELPQGADPTRVGIDRWRPPMTFGEFSEVTFAKFARL